MTHYVSPPSWAKLISNEAYRWLAYLADIVNAGKTYTVTINPASVSANTTSEQTFTVTGIKTDDMIYINKPTHTAGLGIVNARVSAKDTIEITFMNATGSPIDPPSEDYLIKSARL